MAKQKSATTDVGTDFNRAEAAAYLHVSLRWLRGAMERGEIPYYKLNRLVRFCKSDLDEYLASARRVGR